MNIDQDLVTAAAVARRVQVGRAAVSNWRKRYPDFPAPVRDGLLSWAQVEAWLIANGKAEQLAAAGRTDTGTQRIGAAEQERDVTGLSPRQLLARLIASLLPPMGWAPTPVPPDVTVLFDDRPRINDPACGDGTVLAAVADRFGDHVTLLGVDVDRDRADSAHRTLDAHDRNPTFLVLPVDSLRRNHTPEGVGKVDAFVCVAPRTAKHWPAAEH